MKKQEELIERYISLYKILCQKCKFDKFEFENRILALKNLNTIDVIEDLNFQLINAVKIYDIITKNFNNTEYLNNYLKKYFSILESDNYIKMIGNLSISNKIYMDKLLLIDFYKKYFDDEHMYLRINSSLRPVELAYPQYIGFSYRKNSSVDPVDAFEKSILASIFNLGSIIMNKIKSINLGSDGDFFRVNQDHVDLAANIKDISENEASFQYVVNMFFKVIYESSGVDNNKVYMFAQKNNVPRVKEILDIIKALRGFNFHDCDHLDSKKKSMVIKYMKDKIGKNYPIIKSDWTKLQLALYHDVDELLTLISDNMKK